MERLLSLEFIPMTLVRLRKDPDGFKLETEACGWRQVANWKWEVTTWKVVEESR